MLPFKRILVLAPHTDDGELGCGATLAAYCKAGATVHYAAFSTCKESLPAGLAPDTLKQECIDATGILGIPASRVVFFDYAVRQMPANRQSILDSLLQLKTSIAPDLVFLPAAADIHQDHHTIYEEGLRAFKYCSLAGYELPWNNKSFAPTWFHTVSEEALELKTTALQCYQSQQHRAYMRSSFIRSLAEVRGVQSGQNFAEAFEVYRMY